MPSKKPRLASYRVSYYFADTAESDGRVRLHTAVAKALNEVDATAQVTERFRGAPGQLVIRSVYRSKKTPSMKRRATYIFVAELAKIEETHPCPECGSMDANHISSPEGCSTEDPNNPYSKFVGEITRSLGPCKWHPTAVVLENGYCTALEPFVTLNAMPEFLKEFPLAVPASSLETNSNRASVGLPAPEAPCVSQEVKNEVYAKCEAEVKRFPQLPARGEAFLGTDGIKRTKSCDCPTWCFCIWPLADETEAKADAVARQLAADSVVVDALAEEGLKINPYRLEADRAIDEILAPPGRATPSAAPSSLPCWCEDCEPEEPRESWASQHVGAILLGTGIVAWLLILYGPKAVHYLQGLVR